MTKKGQNLEMHIADDKYFTVKVTRNKMALPLTGATIDWYLGPPDSFSQLVHKSTGGNGVEILSPASAGVVEVHLDPEDTEALAPGRYEHSVIVTRMGGDTFTVATGTMVLLQRRRP